MSSLLFCFLIALWTIILIQTQLFWSCIIVSFFCILIFITLFKQPKIQLPKTVFGLGKSILAISFWSCVGFCLFAYQKSISCINCIYNYLRQNDFSNATVIPKIWSLYPRFIVISGLFVLWSVMFLLICKKGNAHD